MGLGLMHPTAFAGRTSVLAGVFTDFYNLDEAANNADAHDWVGSQDLTQSGSPVRAAAFGSVPFCKTLVAATPKYYSAPNNAIFSCGDIDYCWVGWFNIAAAYTAGNIMVSQGSTNGEYSLSASVVLTISCLRFAIFGGGGTGSQAITTDDMSPTFGLWSWVYVEHKASNNTMRIYTRTPGGIHSYDSGSIATTKTPAADPTGIFGFGISANGSFAPLEGKMTSWGFKKSGTLTTAQMDAHYNAGNGVTAPSF